MPSPVRIGTRGSPLALRQAGIVAEALKGARPGLEVEIVPIRTSGDRLAQANLAEHGGKGLFVKEIEEALLAKEVDLAVHSLKDLPGELPAGLTLGAYPEREDPRDVLVARSPGGLDALPLGAAVGTSSLRRRVQLLALRPDLRVVPFRGNLDTRLRKLGQGVVDATLLAAAGMNRLGVVPEHATILDPDRFLPAVGQGILALEVLLGDTRMGELLAPLDHPPTRRAAEAERAFLSRLGGGCHIPVAAYAREQNGALLLQSLVADPDARQVIREEATGSLDEAATLGMTVAERILSRGGAGILAAFDRPGITAWTGPPR